MDRSEDFVTSLKRDHPEVSERAQFQKALSQFISEVGLTAIAGRSFRIGIFDPERASLESSMRSLSLGNAERSTFQPLLHLALKLAIKKVLLDESIMVFHPANTKLNGDYLIVHPALQLRIFLNQKSGQIENIRLGFMEEKLIFASLQSLSQFEKQVAEQSLAREVS